MSLTVAQLVEQMRATLQPKGTADLVVLRAGGPSFSGIFRSTEQIQRAIAEFEKLCLAAPALGDPPNELERLGIELLLNTCGRHADGTPQ